jgi:hypothetical protein
MTTSAEVRKALVATLALDLIGPGPGHPLAGEQLWEGDPPSRWYLTGFLVPTRAPESQRFDPSSVEGIGAPIAGDDGAGPSDDDTTPEVQTPRKVYLPSSLGVSILVPASAESLQVELLWGDYKKIVAAVAGASGVVERKVWQREPRSELIQLPLTAGTMPLDSKEVPNSRGVKIYLTARPVGERAGLPPGTRAVSVFVVNERDPKEEERVEEANLFQVELRVSLPANSGGFVPRANVRGLRVDDPDERIADLQYADVCEFAVGHGVATHAIVKDGRCDEVRTTFLPQATVERVEAGKQPKLTLQMETLADMASADEVVAELGKLPVAYAEWITAQGKRAHAAPRRAAVASDLLERCSLAERRIREGIELLREPVVLDAFRIANRAMARAARQRNAQIHKKSPEEVDRPAWRPFQLAFLLLNLRGIVEPQSADREVVDLLFFPTGGGKTEAYLGLSAFTLVLRRLRDPSLASAGVAVLMRYTLRLLTLDQLGRAAGLICALELERQKAPAKLGKWPFEIGLWVGRKATPNRLGKKGDIDPSSARSKTLAYKNDSRNRPVPIPLEKCPWCGHKFGTGSFNLVPNDDQPTDLKITCANPSCAFTRDRPLPIVAIDEPLYRRLPCFLIATVDKLASLPWLAAPGKLFGKVTSYDAAGFYGPGDRGSGTRLPKPLLPPELIIQDELHLISGPLGTMVGLYETAVEALCTREVGDKLVLPKIVASTATVRRAEAQVRALFGRSQVDVFPPPGPDRRDTFFARTASPIEKEPRLYVGVAAQGRSLKVVLLRTYLALLSAAKVHYEAAGGAQNPDNPADPYMTLLGYFNALRELGGSRRIVEDEVRGRLTGYGRRRRMNEPPGHFTDRTIRFETLELTSRVDTSEVSVAKEHLSLPFSSDQHVDVALATNMISVGLDISRLGLLVVLGQPKMTAEYIQATSRVGREEAKPGLVVTLLNVHKPRDRSHYERFEAYHETFYRAVEATSVTPFAPRAIDRGLAAVTVTLARHGEPAMTKPIAAGELPEHRSKLDFVRQRLRKRAENHRKFDSSEEQAELCHKVEARLADLLDAWEGIARAAESQSGLQYWHEVSSRQALLHAPLDPDLKREPPQSPLRKFKAQWSLRDVEAEVPVLVKRLDGGEV